MALILLGFVRTDIVLLCRIHRHAECVRVRSDMDSRAVILIKSTLCCAVAAVRVSAAGAPLVVLSNRTAHTFHRGMRCWMCLADTAFPASAFHSSLAPASGALPCCILGEACRSRHASSRHPWKFQCSYRDKPESPSCLYIALLLADMAAVLQRNVQVALAV